MSDDPHKGIKVGDLITAYHAGYHRVVGFHTYADKHPAQQVEYQTLLNKAGKSSKVKRTKSCHIDYCEVVTEAAVQAQFEAEVKAAEAKRDSLLSTLTKDESDED